MKKPTLKSQVPLLLRPFASYIKRVKDPITGKESVSYSISNVTVNHFLSPLYFVFIYFYVKGAGFTQTDSLVIALKSTAFYFWTSIFFQPDLDQTKHRAGEHTFPFGFGSDLRKVPVLNLLVITFWPINRLWYWFWEPIGQAFTHRGALHWPIIGVWIRVLWVWGGWNVIQFIMFTLGVQPGPISVTFEYWLRSFFPWNDEFGGVFFFCYALPVYISDLAHSGVDFLESRKNGTPFCARLHRRGLLIKTFNYVRDIPRRVKDQATKF